MKLENNLVPLALEPTSAPAKLAEELPGTLTQAMQTKVARPSRRLKKQVTETALEILNNALAPVEEKNAKLRKQLKDGEIGMAASYEAFTMFEQALGGREALMNVMRYLPENATGNSLLHKLMEDPDFLAINRKKNNEEVLRYSLAILCRRHKLSLATLVEAFRDAKTAQLTIQALTQMAPHAKDVVEQIVDDSKNRFVKCHVCGGTARIPRIGDDGEFMVDENDEVVDQLCYECRGTGQLWQKHDLQNRKIFLQMTRLLEEQRKEPTVNVNLQQANMFGGQFIPGDGSFERIVKNVNIQSAPTKTPSEEVITDIPCVVLEDDAFNPPQTAGEGAG